MIIIKTYLGSMLTLGIGTISLGAVLLAAIPQVEADPWWTPVSMRSSQYSENRHARDLPVAASGIAVASGVAAASGIPAIGSMAGASAVAATAAAASAVSAVAAP